MCKYRTYLIRFFPSIHFIFDWWAWSTSWKSHIVGGKGDGSIRLDHKITFTLDIRTIEVVHIGEFHDYDSEYILIWHTLWGEELRPATEEFPFYTVFVDDIFSECCIEWYGFYYRLQKVFILFECYSASLFSDHLTRDLSGNGENLSFVFYSISNTNLVWITRKRDHIISSEWIGLILDDDVTDFWEIDPIICRTIASNILNRLEYNSSDTCPLLGMGNEFRNLSIIESLVNHTNKCCWDIVFFEHLKSLLSGASHISVSYGFEGISIQRVKLKIYFKSFSNIFEFFYEFLILRDTNTVCVEHQMTNGTRLQILEYLDNIRMDTRLSSSDLNKIRGWFNHKECFVHFFDLVHCSIVPTSRFGRVVADITLHIAFIDHVEEGETWMVLMLRTDSTVKRTTTKNRSECFFWKIGFLEVVITLSEVFEIIWNNRPGFPTVRTEFTKPDFLSFTYDMSWDEPFLIFTLVTEWFRSIQEEIVFGRVESHRIDLKK